MSHIGNYTITDRDRLIIIRRAESIVILFILFLMLVAVFTAADSYASSDLASVSLKSTETEIGIGNTETIKLINVPRKAKITFKINKKKIASVTKKGKVTAKKPGKAVVTVRITKGKKSKKLKYTVYVRKPACKDDAISVEKNESKEAVVLYKPAKNYKAKYKWSSQNPEIATVSKGVITGITEGNTRISVKIYSKNKFSYSISWDVTVTEGKDLPAASDIDLGTIEELIEDDTIVVTQNDDTSIRTIDGAFTDTRVRDEDDALNVIGEISPILTRDNKDVAATIGDIETSSSEEAAGNGEGTEETYYLLRPEVDGIPVEGSDLILVTDQYDRPSGLVNSYEDGIEETDTYADDDYGEDAEIAVRDSIWDEMSEWLDEDTLDSLMDALWIDKDLVVYSGNGVREPVLTWKLNVTTYYDTEDSTEMTLDEVREEEPEAEDISELMLPEINRIYYVYANGDYSGEILKSVDLTQESWTDVTNTAEGLKGDVTFRCQKEGNEYRLVDSGRNIWTYQMLYEPHGFLGLGGGVTALPPGRIMTKGLFGWNKKAVSVHSNMAKVYDFYKNNLGRQSYDGCGSPVVISIEYSEDSDYALGWLANRLEDNACWTPYYEQFFFYEKGNREGALDTCGHEYTHAVINTIVGGTSLDSSLEYEGESGALNESYADIMGSIIEGKPRNSYGRWVHSEDGDKPRRSLSDPASFTCSSINKPYPDHYNKRYTGDTDFFGVHINSSIFNFAAYKMITDDRTASISDVTWAKVFYRSLRRLTTDASFVQASAAVLASARSLGFSEEQLKAIEDAYTAVGIRDTETVRIVLQWGAEPEDLDSHLVGPTTGGKSRFHVYFDNKEYRGDETISTTGYFADLDYDCTEGNGIEVTSIRRLEPGDYYFYVHDYSNKEETESNAMAGSNAVVKVYYGISSTLRKQKDGQDACFNISRGSSGTLWTVMKIHIDKNKSVTIEPINTYSYHENESTI